MRLLLDTHTFLWFTATPGNLSETALDALNDPGNDVLLSMASAWEMSIKAGLGKLGLSQKVVPFVRSQAAINGFQILPISLDHIALIDDLPLHHRDPSDRLLVAQAMAEDIPIVSIDAVLDAYSVQRVW